MGKGQERYEERRQAEHDAEVARIRMQEKHYVAEANTEEAAAYLTRALTAFLRGEGAFCIRQDMDARGWRISFDCPALKNTTLTAGEGTS